MRKLKTGDSIIILDSIEDQEGSDLGYDYDMLEAGEVGKIERIDNNDDSVMIDNYWYYMKHVRLIKLYRSGLLKLL